MSAGMEIQALNEEVDTIVHEPKRLALLAVLASGPLTFADLKEVAELTDGNLDSHIRKLEGAGYVRAETRKNPLVRRQKETVYSATDKGRKAFDDYIASMERKLQEAKSITEQ